MKHFTRSTKSVLVLIVIAVFALAAGVVSAQEPDLQPDGPRNDNGRRGERAVMQAILAETGLSGQELREQLGDGVTLADVIEANGGSVQNVIDAVVADASTRLSEAVANERITQEQMDETLANLPTTITEALNGEFSPRPPRDGQNGPRNQGQNQQRAIMDAIAEATGLEASAIREAIRDGSTPAEVITANGGDVNAVIATVVTSASERINEAVTNERITQEQADEILSGLEARITDFMNGIRPERNQDEGSI